MNESVTGEIIRGEDIYIHSSRLRRRSFDNFRPQVLKSVTLCRLEEIIPNNRRFYSPRCSVYRRKTSNDCGG